MTMIKQYSISNKSSFKVCLLGASLDTGNMGVSALAASVIKLVLAKKLNAKITLVIGNRQSETNPY